MKMTRKTAFSFTRFNGRRSHISIGKPNVDSTLSSVHTIISIVHHCRRRCVTERKEWIVTQFKSFWYEVDSLHIIFVIVDDNSGWHFEAHLWNRTRYWFSHQLESRDWACLLSELATGRKPGSGFHSALSRLATPEFIYEQSLLSSWWETQ